jgi:hypothetical protein
MCRDISARQCNPLHSDTGDSATGLSQWGSVKTTIKYRELTNSFGCTRHVPMGLQTDDTLVYRQERRRRHL